MGSKYIFRGSKYNLWYPSTLRWGQNPTTKIPNSSSFCSPLLVTKNEKYGWRYLGNEKSYQTSELRWCQNGFFMPLHIFNYFLEKTILRTICLSSNMDEIQSVRMICLPNFWSLDILNDIAGENVSHSELKWAAAMMEVGVNFFQFLSFFVISLNFSQFLL